MNAAIFPRSLLVVALLVGVSSCDGEPTGVDGTTGTVIVQVTRTELTDRLDVVRATFTGPTERDVDLVAAGDDRLGATVSGLEPGTYALAVAGRIDGEVDHFGRVAEYRVGAGARQQVVVPFTSYVPALPELGSPTTRTAHSLGFPPVAHADSYLVELDRDPSFADAAAVILAGNATPVAAADTGAWHVRVRAVGSAAGIGRASDARTFTVVTDLRPSGDEPAGAADLGFAAAATGTYDGLNILPAGDADWFRVRLCRDDYLHVRVTTVAAPGQTPLATRIEVVDTAGNAVAGSRRLAGLETESRALVPESGAYLLAVRGDNNTVGGYELHVQVTPGPDTGETDCAGGPSFAGRLDAGMVHTCGVAGDGTAHCWGDNAFGQLGDGTRTGRGDPVAVTGGLTFRAISAGWEHTCGLSASYEVWCWGRNDDGRLGDGSFTDRAVPVRVTGDLRFRAVSAGVEHTCGVTTGGEIWCWGVNGDGRLGDGGLAASAVPVLVQSTQTFVSASTGFRHTCAVTTAATLYCWGGDPQGQVGNGAAQGSISVPQRIDPGQPIRQVSAGFEHTCAIATGGDAWCWGFNRIGQLGNGETYVVTETPTRVAGGVSFRGISVSFGADTTGGAHTCALDQDGAAWCWGLNVTGQVGGPTNEVCDKPDIIDVKQFPCATTPRQVDTDLRFTTITAGLTHSCALTEEGEAWCWGDNQAGQGGDGTTPTTTPMVVAGGLALAQIHPAKFHTCALTPDGSAWCWGDNPYGQLGDGTTSPRLTPAAVSGGLQFATFTAGQDHTCGTTADDTAYCWGKGVEGQLGIGTLTSVSAPTAVAGNYPFGAITAGDRHTCALASDSLAYCWGNGAEGRTGTNEPGILAAPAAVAGNHRFATIEAGNIHACAPKASGALYCWGYNSDGQIGNGAGSTDDFSPVPDSVLTTRTFIEVSTGFYHTCGVTTGGEAWCWGDNASGQLGDGTFEDHRIPTHVAVDLSFTSVSAGFYHTCGLTSAGEIWCWGDNLWGQLGTGETADRNAPVRVSGGLTFTRVFSGDHHTCGITTTGQAYCWGRNCRGQLGIGRWSITYAPLPVTGGLSFRPPATD